MPNTWGVYRPIIRHEHFQKDDSLTGTPKAGMAVGIAGGNIRLQLGQSDVSFILQEIKHFHIY